MWKHEKRLGTSVKSNVSTENGFQVERKSFFKKYVSILVGSGVLGFFIVRRVHPDYRKPGIEASNLEVKEKG
ncbi:hypothetical protein Phum_PHUM283360 [Pediculus humanus corporis]|uniref:Uncharacterized protein n=1 Tax=Pediculus humanus subsp. corporis TaxID=121224 RepID=E0VL74_PEDHC|nr:uncharacterized protein Phum_PHUM283360 [Pediculus humanus corporis]EEB14130.1 hypothetical protein Phum_PHUM283360 [Pediculus humanus corporis]